MRTCLIALTLSISGFLYALTMPAYTDKTAFNEKYMAVDSGDSKTVGEEFRKLRKEFLTARYKLEDYSLAATSIAALGVIFFWLGGINIKAPNRKYWTALIGIGAAILTSCATVGLLFLDAHRGAYPHWADSLGILLAGIPFITGILLAWASLHFLFLFRKFEPNRNIFPIQFSMKNAEPIIISAVTAVLIGLASIEGSFLYIIPGGLWLYFYLSLTGRSKKSS